MSSVSRAFINAVLAAVKIMNRKLNSEYKFVRSVNEKLAVELTVYINYENKTYDIVQSSQEGIFFRHNNKETEVNKTYVLLALEALEFVQSELYSS